MTLSHLRARVEAAEGPDKGLDGLIWAALQGVELVEWDYTTTGDRLSYAGDLKFPDWRGPPEMTRSIDIALFVVEQALPGWRVALDSDHDRRPLWRASIKRSGENWPPKQMAPTAPLAILKALLTALESHHAR